MNRTLSTAVLCSAVATGALCADAASAHHSFAMFDRNTTSVIDGTIKEFQWTSPHMWIQLVAPDKDGKLVEYGFEGGPPSNGQGWSRHSLKAGDKVKITYHPLRTGGAGGEFMQAVFPSGATVPDRSAARGAGARGAGGPE
ncbi:MAG TPA: DUF6152 family protein [Caulobacteraceae bacterium]|jgi:hypothetical protein|nr:DUF6152 family protein [Caulobacteraceae bacterium]